VKAENAGFEFAMISDHYHPWISNQGNSPFVWSTLGAIANATKKITIGTGVTCPIIRIHPAIIAQAAATTASLLEDRFILGLGTGENLNEHVVAEGWPTIDTRLEMLQEAVEIIRELWKGENYSHYGSFYAVEDARIYSLPEKLPPIYIASGGPKSAKLTGNIGDGLISTSPKKSIVEKFESSGGKGKPTIGQFQVVVANDKDKALDILWQNWPNTGLRGQLSQELRLPAYFEDAVKMLDKSDLAEVSVLGKDKKDHLNKIEEFKKAGFDMVYVHQVGNNQDDFFEFYKKHILPEFN
jgi:G6PDH family F420-dependent oxidoreductase